MNPMMMQGMGGMGSMNPGAGLQPLNAGLQPLNAGGADDDLSSLLDSLDTTPQRGQGAARRGDAVDDLAALLNQMESSGPSAVSPKGKPGRGEDDLGALLDAFDKPSGSTPARQAPRQVQSPAANKDATDALSDLLGELGL